MSEAMEAGRWTHRYLRCSSCGGQAAATDTNTPDGRPQRTVRCTECDAPPVTFTPALEP